MHKAILSLIYGAGLRISEYVQLQLVDIDSPHMRIWVRNGKGEKDRITLLSNNLLALLRAYYRIYRPKSKASVNSNTTLQTLRHSSSKTTKI